DTGASYTVLPKETLERIGAARITKAFYIHLADGRKVKATAYAVTVSMKGVEAPCVCISFKNAQNLIGVETLEAIGVKLDPVKRKLEFTRPKGTLYCLTTC
ncbi:MAG: retroviral-like aspartic protease family protein, partial [Planctomycetes bacterium]|nr:retroviral-like aspartic protease family protein [Planctomycetota bacterium]